MARDDNNARGLEHMSRVCFFIRVHHDAHKNLLRGDCERGVFYFHHQVNGGMGFLRSGSKASTMTGRGALLHRISSLDILGDGEMTQLGEESCYPVIMDVERCVHVQYVNSD